MKCVQFEKELLDLIKESQDWDDPVDFGRLCANISDFAWPLIEDRDQESYEEGYEDGKNECDCPEPEFGEVGGQTLDDLRTGLALLKTDPTAASVYLDRVLRDFKQHGFHNGKLL